MAEMLQSGGWPGQALVLVSLLLWSLVWLRAAGLKRSVVDHALRSFDAEGHPPPTALRDRAVEQLGRGREILRALVVAAPLLGLLGTVSGMVELFDALHGGQTTLGQGSVAGGISTALLTTQLGLVIGVPGLVAARLLEQHEKELCAALDEGLHRRPNREAQP